MSSPQPGRVDEAQPLISWEVKASLTLAVVAVGALLLWWAALVLTATGTVSLRLTVRALTRGHPLAGLAPVRAATEQSTLTVFGVLLAVSYVLLPVVLVFVGRWFRGRADRAGFASRRQVQDGLGEARARLSAAQTRPGLSPAARRRAPVEQIGLPLGTASKAAVVLPLEDHVVVVSLTGGGKTVGVMIPAALSAPGALVVTCTRADILDVIATQRSELGSVWVFDPLERSGWPSPMTWDPVLGCEDGATALARGLAFVGGLSADDTATTNAGFFKNNAASAMTRLLHAAALGQRGMARLLHAAALGQRGMAEVIDWAVHLDDGALEPQKIIELSSHPLAEPSWAGPAPFGGHRRGGNSVGYPADFAAGHRTDGAASGAPLGHRHSRCPGV